MNSPDYDPCSATGQIAACANLIVFTTGRGTVFSSKPAPCVKLA
jgi:altronate hydrolase